MKNLFFTLSIFMLVLFTSCSSSDDNTDTPLVPQTINNTEYITWSSLNTNYNTTTIFRQIDGVIFELTGEVDPFFNLSIDVDSITEGLVVEVSESNGDSFYLGYDTGVGENVLEFSVLRVEFVEVNDTYIYGEFQASEANVVDKGVVPNTSTPSDAVITNGKFRINL